jgi:hypothetical protein
MSVALTTDLLVAALAVAAGREPARQDVAAAAVVPDTLASRTPAEVLALATRLVTYGRVIAAETPCPMSWIRRAEELFEPRRRPLGVALWSLLFDSAAALSPATRGMSRSRFVRIGGEGGTIQAELTGLGTDDVRLVGALEGSKPGAVVVLEPVVEPVGAAAKRSTPRTPMRSLVRAAVDDGGTFEMAVPKTATSFTLAVRVGRRVVARSPVLGVQPK